MAKCPITAIVSSDALVHVRPSIRWRARRFFSFAHWFASEVFITSQSLMMDTKQMIFCCPFSKKIQYEKVSLSQTTKKSLLPTDQKIENMFWLWQSVILCQNTTFFRNSDAISRWAGWVSFSPTGILGFS